jgi:SNF2 family DNA or RNA helicase
VHVFAVITLLKQICNDPALVDPRYQNMGSGKLEVLDEIVAESLASNQKIVIFSQYAKMVARLSERFARQGIRHVTLTGSTTKRGDVIREFQENAEIKIFVGSLLAGGAGIDLTAASVVIHFDRWWNAAKENQATDRIHRFGQMRNVQVYKLVTRGTLEERIDEIIARKRIVFERFIEQDTEMFKQLTREDLLNLLATPNESATGSDIEAEEALLRNSIEDAGTL